MSHTNISLLPWTYKQSEGAFGKRDWIEDANGDIQLEAVGHLDGPFICEAVNSHDRLTAEVARLKLATLRAVDYFKARNLGDTAEELLKYLQEALNPEEPK